MTSVILTFLPAVLTFTVATWNSPPPQHQPTDALCKH
jgi:hypothetical protein